MKEHRIFDFQGKFVTTLPWIDDENEGLPDWYFNGDFMTITVDTVADKVEFVPAMGPAPCWEDQASKYPTNEALFAGFAAWHERTY